MKCTKRNFLKYLPLSIAGIAIPTTAMVINSTASPAEVRTEYRHFQEVHWFDDKGKIVIVEKVPIKDNVSNYSTRVSRHIRERIS